MKLSISASILALSILCAAQLQTLSEIPDCAKPCAASLPSNCNLGVQCICSDQAFITGISCCIEKACSASDQQKTLMLAQQLCDTVKVTLPSAASCPASEAATGASTASGASGAAVAGGSTATSATSNSATVATGAMSNASGSVMSTTSTIGTSTGTSTGTTTGTPTSTMPSTSTSATAANGAAQVVGSRMGAIGVAVAALALL